MDYYDYDSFCYSARDLKLIRPLVEWPQHSLYHNTLLSSDHGIPRIKQEELGGFPSYPHYQQPWSYDAYNLPEQPSHHSPYSAILLPLHSEAASISRQDMDEMTAMIDAGNVVEDIVVGDEDAEGDDEMDEISNLSYQKDTNETTTTRGKRTVSSPVASSLPIPIPVPNLTKKSRGRRVPTMSSLEDIRSAASGAGRKRQSIGGKSARMYLCEVAGCGKCFARGEHLKRHVRSIHTYEKPHRCPYPGCGKDFSRHDNLVQHMRVHKDYVLPRSRSSSSSSFTT